MEQKALKVANILLIGGSAYCALIFFYGSYVHGPTLHYNLLQIVLAAALLGALRLRASHKINFVLILLCVMTSAYLLELYLLFAAARHSNAHATMWLRFPSDISLETLKDRLSKGKHDDANYDTRSRLEVITDMRKSGIDAYPAVFSSVLLKWDKDGRTLRSQIMIDGEETLPLGGISNTRTVFCNENGQYTIYESDEHGFHNPTGIWKSARMDIVTLGDSFTHGACVPSEQSFVGLIRNRYPATLNLGIDDSGPVTMLAMLKEYGRHFRPKAVLWFYYEGNDLKDLKREHSSPLLMKYMAGPFAQGLIEKQEKIDSALRAYVDKAREAGRQSIQPEEIVKLRHLRAYVHSVLQKGQQGGSDQIMRNYFTMSASEATAEELDLLRRALMEAQACVGKWGGRLYFVYLPEWPRYAKPELANKDRQRVLTLARDLHLPVIDLHAAFTQHADPLSLFPFRRFGHYNSGGHRLVAQTVLHALSLPGGEPTVSHASFPGES